MDMKVYGNKLGGNYNEQIGLINKAFFYDG